ncbi:hypothetical protein BJX61DRAFT_154273 [Aspergillus egyptiacus]|nr:hypothetical protein BJX61DRAFT_154273 [Aspergillus egyptiacus]
MMSSSSDRTILCEDADMAGFEMSESDTMDHTPTPVDKVSKYLARQNETLIPEKPIVIGTINPALLSIQNTPGPMHYDMFVNMSQKLWNAVFANKVERVRELMNYGASPMHRTPTGVSAVELAIRMGHVEIVSVFHRDMELVYKIGLRSILLAIRYNERTIVEELLKFGVQHSLSIDETAKVIVFGWVCRHGNPAILNTLVEYGPWFSWRAYHIWCLGEATTLDNRLKIFDIATKYLAVCVFPQPTSSWTLLTESQEQDNLAARGLVTDSLVANPEQPTLYETMREYNARMPESCIGDLWMEEYSF